jgi:putative transposon-encoded protein
MEDEIININGDVKVAIVKDITVRDGKGSGRINVPTKYIGNKFRMYLI